MEEIMGATRHADGELLYYVALPFCRLDRAKTAKKYNSICTTENGTRGYTRSNMMFSFAFTPSAG